MGNIPPRPRLPPSPGLARPTLLAPPAGGGSYMFPTPLSPLPRSYIGDVFYLSGAGGGILIYNLIPKGGLAPSYLPARALVASGDRSAPTEAGAETGRLTRATGTQRPLWKPPFFKGALSVIASCDDISPIGGDKLCPPSSRLPPCLGLARPTPWSRPPAG